ncbi:MAG: hypothetical protein ACK4YP_00335 [Myxococcota bacterium]
MLHLALLAGCDQLAPSRRALLPSELSVLAETTDGEPLSLLLGLRRNSRDQLDVRIAEGAQVYDGRRVWALEGTAGGLAVVDRVTGERVVFAAGQDPRLLALHQRTAWLEGPAGTLACSLKDGRCGIEPIPDLPLDHPGPGAGFQLALHGETLRVHLPQEQVDGIVLAEGIARVIGVYWVRGSTGEADAVVHRTFRGRARVHALARPVTADGDLGDWPDAAPLVVEAPWQLQSGADGWSGERDASFSVAATWSADTVCVAGRIRDEDVRDGDVLTVRVDTTTRTFPLTGAAPAGGALERGWLAAAWEACLPLPAMPGARIPFAVSYTDADGDGPVTVLASAPSAGDVPLGELVLDAPARVAAP